MGYDTSEVQRGASDGAHEGGRIRCGDCGVNSPHKGRRNAKARRGEPQEGAISSSDSIRRQVARICLTLIRRASRTNQSTGALCSNAAQREAVIWCVIPLPSRMAEGTGFPSKAPDPATVAYSATEIGAPSTCTPRINSRLANWAGSRRGEPQQEQFFSMIKKSIAWFTHTRQALTKVKSNIHVCGKLPHPLIAQYRQYVPH